MTTCYLNIGINLSNYSEEKQPEHYRNSIRSLRRDATPAMGASTSSEPRVSEEQNEAESVAASTGALPMLEKAFSKLANPQTNAVSLENLQVLFKMHNNLLVLDLFFVPF